MAAENKSELKSRSIDFGSLVVTDNGRSSQIFDAVADFRAFLYENDIHDYETQTFGGYDFSESFPATFVGPDGQETEFTVRMYRAFGRGDRRLSFVGLSKAIVPLGDIGFVWTEERFWVFGLSDLELPVLESRSHALESAFRTISRYRTPRSSESSELEDAEFLADIAAGKVTKGRRLQNDPFVRRAVERRAVEVVSEYLIDLGYQVRDVGATSSYDLDARRGAEHLYVEVKGTISTGERVILTRNEVALHTTQHPNNMLAVVSSIAVDRSGESPTATGGLLKVASPWLVEANALDALSYDYVVPKVL
jgi:hypothetical protein